MKINFETCLQNKLKMQIFEIRDVVNSEKDNQLWDTINAQAEYYKNTYSDFSECKPLLQPARKLYKAIGIEPSRYRPASEALIKRVLKNKGLYQVNTLVDFGNYCSLKFMVPVGLYDLDKIQFPIKARIGYADEAYEGLGKAEVLLHDKLVLADNYGPFGNPSSDSKRTSVSLDTKNLLFVYFYHFDMDGQPLNEIEKSTIELIKKFLTPAVVTSYKINFKHL